MAPRFHAASLLLLLLGSAAHAQMQPFTSLPEAVEAVQRDAAKRTGDAQAEVFSAESVLWGDGSLGCPRKGMTYLQRQLPGYRIKVRAGGADYDYHVDARGLFAVCPEGAGVDPAPDPRT